jgi:CspA family cold shock protein
MATGTVKWFNNAKGYGFVLPEGSGDDLFIHYSSIQMDGYKSLKAGQVIDYDVQAGPKGMHAVNIRAGSSSETEPEAALEPAPHAQIAQSAVSHQSVQREVEVEEG